jgi:CheY-like chemotaxis protein
MPDVLVVDVAMPGVDELSVTRRLRQGARRADPLADGARRRSRSGSPASTRAPTTTSSSRSRPRSWSPACALLRRNRPPEQQFAFADLSLEVGSGAARWAGARSS